MRTRGTRFSVAVVGAMLLAGGLFQNCSQSIQFSPASDKTSEASISKGPNMADSQFTLTSNTQFVCEPFGGSVASTNAQAGLKASLRYLDTSAVSNPNGVTIADYYSPHQKGIVTASQDFYFSQVFVPTRPFSSGFEDGNGGFINDQQGQMLTEYFSLEYNSILHLTSSDFAGYYRFSIISDDGATLEAKINGQWQTLVDNDGTHAAKMGCMSGTIYMDGQTQLPIRLRYYQGPRYEIADVLMWQFEGSRSMPPADQECGDVTSFFNETTSQPQQSYKDLLSRGWAPVSADNFQLPDQEINPCVAGSTVILNNTSLVTAFNGDVHFAFDTNIPVQTEVTVSSGGHVVLKSQESTTASQHDLNLGGLSGDQSYDIKIHMLAPSLGFSLTKTFRMDPTLN